MIDLLAGIFIKDKENYTDSAVRRAYGMLCSVVGIVLNLLLFAGKYLAGVISGSIAITADAFNNLSVFFGGRYSFTPMVNPDYMKIAEAYQIPSRRVMKREELEDAIQEMLTTDGPYLLETCVIEEGNVLPMTPPGGTVNEMLLDC